MIPKQNLFKSQTNVKSALAFSLGESIPSFISAEYKAKDFDRDHTPGYV